jgi:gamma-glutamylcyclotransferase (GGCT)/AIG2-like uncharacterized protein YtfP
MSNILYVYGTLRPGNADTVKVKGQLYDLGWFPGIKLGGTGDVICEKIEVQDWSAVDRYEGYMPSDPANSLYIRVPFGDGFIYEFNRDVNPVKLVPTGDWLDYTKEKRGVNGGRF